MYSPKILAYHVLVVISQTQIHVCLEGKPSGVDMMNAIKTQSIWTLNILAHNKKKKKPGKITVGENLLTDIDVDEMSIRRNFTRRWNWLLSVICLSVSCPGPNSDARTFHG
jgi:hypothetical protein